MSVVILREDIPAEYQAAIISDLTITFPKASGKEPLVCHERDEDNNLVCPLDYGLNLCKVHGWAELTDIEIPPLEDQYQSIIPLYPHQEVIVSEIFEHLDNNRTAVLAAYTSVGKTMMTTHIIQRLGVLGLVVMTGKTLIEQWITEFGNTTTAVLRVIGNKNEKDRYYYQGEEVQSGGYHVIICMVKRIHRIEREVLDNVGILVMDEAHQFCSVTRVKDILMIHPHYVLHCTATPRKMIILLASWN